MDNNDERSFEEAMKALEDRVRRLESADLALEKALEVFEDGVSLARECHEKLDAADRRIVALTRGEDGTIQERELE